MIVKAGPESEMLCTFHMSQMRQCVSVKAICIYIPVSLAFTPWLLILEGYREYVEACLSVRS
jgi:hypothetical protein